MTTAITMIIICWILAGACIAIGHTLTYKFDKSVFKNWKHSYWKASVSWKSMYKDNIPPTSAEYKGEKFPGSTTIFKFMCDGWSLMRALTSSFMLLSLIVLWEYFTGSSWYENLTIFIVLNLVKEIVYNIVYRGIV